MEANRPSRQSKRKGDLPTSSVATGVETRSKRRKREQGGASLQVSSPGARQEQHVETGDLSEASECLDARDMQMESDGEGTISDSDAETQDSSDTKDCEDRVSRFPQLVQDTIFGFLNNCDKIQAAQVCSDWLHAVYKPCLWRHQKVSTDLDRVTKEELLSLSEREVTQIEVKGRNKSKMKFLLETFPSLVSLHLDSKVQTDIFLQKVSKCEFSSLKELSLKIERNKGHIPCCLQQSLSRLSSLRTISIKGRVTNDHVQAIGRELHGLEELSLQIVSGNLGETVISIRELNSLRCLWSLRLQEATLNDFSDFCQQNSRLTILSLYRCRLPTADWPADLATMTALEELAVQICSPNEKSLEPLQNLVNLKKLDLWPANDRDWRSVAKISSLEEIVLDWTTRMTDETIYALGSNLTRLKAWTLTGFHRVPHEVLLYIARLSSLQSLHVSDLQTDDFLKTLSEGPCNLRRLHLSHVEMTGPLELKHLAQISSLREVVLQCTNVSCFGLSTLQQESFKLETLELVYCGVTVESVMPLLQTQTSLRKLVMVGKGVRKEDFPSPNAVLPNLEVCILRKRSE